VYIFKPIYKDTMEKIFNNTQVAFALKSNGELNRAHFLFKMIDNQPLVRIGTAVTNFALKANHPPLYPCIDFDTVK